MINHKKGLTHQVTFVEEQQHVLMRAIPFEMVLKVSTASSQGIPSIQDLHFHQMRLAYIAANQHQGFLPGCSRNIRLTGNMQQK